ncbi:MAG: hypothetical protein IPJ19_04045 [Planctomycetes bacterium]|nr:hypothetical protein [Planctomycetota bacterium]
MNPTLQFGLLATLLLPSPALAQARMSTLASALETFTAVDLNKDGRLSPSEVTNELRLGPADTRGVDADQDGFWSRDEFLVFYRQRLAAAKVRPAADLEAEATRILAARKAKAGERGGQRALSEARRGAKTPNQVGALSDAVDGLEVKASAGKALPTDFAKVRELLVSEARTADQAAKGADADAGEGSEFHQKLLQSLDRLQAAAGSGNYSRTDYLAFRQALVRRLRNAAESEQPAAGAVSKNADLRGIQQGLVDSLDQLEKRAVAGNATREDFERVRDQLIARARAAANEANTPGAAEQELQGPLHRKMIQSLDRIQAAAAAGNFTRAEYQDFRDSVLARFRNASNVESSPGTQDPNTHLRAIDQGLNDALDQLEKRAAAGGASREDFQRVRDQLIARARAAAQGAPGAIPAEADAGSTEYRKLMQSLDRLEAAAGQGVYSREEYRDLRASMIHRAREAVSASPAEVPGETDDAKMSRAVDEMQKHVDGGRVTPADFENLRQILARKQQALAGKSDPASADEALAYSKMKLAIDRLEKAAQNGSVDRQEFETFRASFVRRARNIVNESKNAGEAPSREPAADPKRGERPAATPPAVRPAPASGGATRRTDPKPPAPQPAPVSRPKPENPEPEKPQAPPQRPANGGGGGRPSGGRG